MSEEKYREEAFVQDAVNKARKRFVDDVLGRIERALLKTDASLCMERDEPVEGVYRLFVDDLSLEVTVEGHQVTFVVGPMGWGVNINYLDITADKRYAAFRDKNAKHTSALIIAGAKRGE